MKKTTAWAIVRKKTGKIAEDISELGGEEIYPEVWSLKSGAKDAMLNGNYSVNDYHIIKVTIEEVG